MLPLFTSQSAKLAKGAGMAIEGLILYLAPAFSSGIRNVCPWASAGCRAVCLGEHSGRMAMSNSRKARQWRTELFYADNASFWTRIRSEITALRKRAAKSNATACVRLDGTSDLGLAKRILADFPDVTFYDYTKSYQRMIAWLESTPRNLWLTFSRSETNETECLDVLARGGNVAIPFDTKKGEAFPATWNGYRIIDGDRHDWRFLDVSEGTAVVVGLRAKGTAKGDRSGFVVRAS